MSKIPSCSNILIFYDEAGDIYPKNYSLSLCKRDLVDKGLPFSAELSFNTSWGFFLNK